MNREEELKGIIKELRRIRKNIKNKIYRLDNPEKVKESYKKWWDNIPEEEKEKFRESQKKWIEENYQKYKDSRQKYLQTEKGKKANRISLWKYRGLNEEDYEIIYKRYLNTTNCDWCDILLTCDKKSTPTTKCMDHCHDTGLFRNILCNSCNRKRN